MPGKTPHPNGKEPVENDVRNNKDVDMTDEKSTMKGKKNVKEGEDMTVVVPPSKAAKQSSQPPHADAEGDVAMDDSDKAEELEPKVDPVAQAISGRFLTMSGRFLSSKFVNTDILCPQISRAILPSSIAP